MTDELSAVSPRQSGRAPLPELEPALTGADSEIGDGSASDPPAPTRVARSDIREARSANGVRAGEIVAVATTTLTAQSYEMNRAPAFGALLSVPAGPMTYYALCYATETGSIEPGRHAVAWGRFEDDDDDIYRRQPQLEQVLRTTFDALLVGYQRDAAPVQRIPPRPPRLHAIVYEATSHDVARFNDDLTYLRFVLRTPLPNADDLVAAAIVQAYLARGGDREFLVCAARSVARALGPEHERVMTILNLLDE